MKYRKEVDGLRALAVLPVILFHAGLPVFGGGFVGVDIFFVISGYLITKIIIEEMEQGSFSLLTFYERRARRILPALFFVILCTLPFAWLWMLPQDMIDFSKSLVAVPIFASNVLFYVTSGYFDNASEFKPLLHTWSLAVEEQYYVLFPLFLMVSWKLGKKWIISALLTIAVISVLAAQWGSSTHAAFVFYLLPTRGFEILVGALVSLIIHYRIKLFPVGRSAAQSASVAGLMLVLYAIFWFDKNTPSPGLYTLIPTIGAALILAFASAENATGRLLGSPAFVGIGLISYSAYLWHQPMLALARIRSIDNHPANSILALICLGSLGLGYLSWKYVENPFRNKQNISRTKLFALSLLASLSFICIGLTIYRNSGFPERIKIPAEVAESISGSKFRENCDRKNAKKTASDVDFCSIGDTDKTHITMAIFGDSHSEAILPVLDKIGKEASERYTQIGLGGCPPLLDVDVANGNWKPKVCEDLAKKEFDFVRENNIKNVFLVGRWSLYTDGNYDDSGIYYLISDKYSKQNKIDSRINFEVSLRNTIQKYQALGAKVFLLAQVPQQKIDGSKLYTDLYYFNVENKSEFIKTVSISKAEHTSLQAYNRSVLKNLQNELHFTYIDVDSQFCDDRKCYFGNDVISNYRDNDHLSIAGSLSLHNIIGRYIKFN